MKVAFTVQHPTHVHFFKNPISKLKNEGHETYILCRKKDVNIDLIESSDIESDYDVLMKNDFNSIFRLISGQITYESRMFNKLRQFQPDILVSEAGVAASHTSKLLGSQNILFINNEHATLENCLSTPLADTIYTPKSFGKKFRRRQKAYNSIFPLSYLHPNYYTPQNDIIEKLGINDDYVVMRLIAWNAAHDINKRGLSKTLEIINKIEESGREVVISAEENVPDEFESYIYPIPANRFHDLLYYADLYIGEGAATAVESSLLATPSIYANSLTMGYIKELEDRGLLFQHSPSNAAAIIDRISQLLDMPNDIWEQRREKALNEYDDMCDIIVEAINDHNTR